MLMVRRIIIAGLAGAWLAGAAGAAAPAGDATVAYSDKVQDIIARFNAKLVEAQPFLVWPGDSLDQDARDKIAWKLEVIINDLNVLKAELDGLAVPAGFDEAHKLIAGSFDLYMTALSRCGTGVQLNYVKTFNGGVVDYNAAGNYLNSGLDEIENALRAAGYSVN